MAPYIPEYGAEFLADHTAATGHVNVADLREVDAIGSRDLLGARVRAERTGRAGLREAQCQLGQPTHARSRGVGTAANDGIALMAATGEQLTHY